MANNLTIDVNINPNGQASTTGVQVNAPTPLNSGFVREKQTGLSNMAVLGSIGLAGKQVFNAATGSIGAYTGRDDLQRKINTGFKVTGRIVLIGSAIRRGGLIGGAIAAIAVATETGIGVFQAEITRQNQNREAEFKRQSLGNLRNESRTD